MSKELPYFRFYPDEYLTGNITLEDEQTQGLFIEICCWYWKKDCIIDIEFIKKRLINAKAMLEQCLNNLIKAEILKENDEGGININFLDEQYDLLNESRQRRVTAGRLGGKHCLSYKDKDKDKIKKIIPEWKNDFDIYRKLCVEGFQKATKDEKFIADLKRIYPQADINKSLELAFKSYWSTEEGWHTKRGAKAKTIIWKFTIINTIKFNIVKK